MTGIFLMFFYRPMADIGGAQAYTDMQGIRTSVFLGTSSATSTDGART